MTGVAWKVVFDGDLFDRDLFDLEGYYMQIKQEADAYVKFLQTQFLTPQTELFCVRFAKRFWELLEEELTRSKDPIREAAK